MGTLNIASAESIQLIDPIVDSIKPIKPIDPDVLYLDKDVLKQNDVLIPYEFTANTPAVASEVNKNFNTLKNKVNAKKPSGIDWKNINKTNIDVTSDVVVATVALNTPSTGYVVVRFDGKAYADEGDRLILAASNDMNWHLNDGSVSFKGDNNAHPFSHTRVYEVEEGSYNFYAVVRNYVDTAGDGRASIYGTLTATYYYTKY